MAYSQFQDQKLLGLIATGDRKAFDELYSRYVEYLYHFAYHILEDSDECQDVIQDVFLWLWDNRQKQKISLVKPYLCAAVKFRLIRSIQQSKRREEILAKQELPTAFDPGDTVELGELKKIIEDLVQDLPPRAREIFELSRFSYLTNKEIAARLDISEKTVENQMTIALRKLHRGLGPYRALLVFLLF